MQLVFLCSALNERLIFSDETCCSWTGRKEDWYFKHKDFAAERYNEMKINDCGMIWLIYKVNLAELDVIRGFGDIRHQYKKCVPHQSASNANNGGE